MRANKDSQECKIIGQIAYDLFTLISLAGDTQGQAEDVEGGEDLIFQEVPDGDLEIVSKHGAGRFQ